MGDTRQKLSHLTIVLHWIVGIAVIGIIAVGIWMTGLPKGEFRSWVYGWHKLAGTTVLMVAAIRILWRWKNGLIEPAGNFPEWERLLSRTNYVVMLVATIALPVSGAIYSYAAGSNVPILGLLKIQSPGKIGWLYDPSKFVHGWAGWILAGLVALHVAGVIKHHFVDRDGTLRRMLGARVG